MDIEKLKQKVLDLAIKGKLVPQDPNDEPASVLIGKIKKEKEELIKQGKIKPSKNDSYIYKGSDNCYYEKELTLGEILDYVQPSQYIVQSTNYDDSYKIPVLTAGKSFILGYTDEKNNIFKASDENVIIFDDFTTASKFVDFDFKVKSSAIKILKTKDFNKYNIKYIYYYLLTIKIIVNTHKRFWISEYQSIKISIPPYWYQTTVVDLLDIIFIKLDLLSKCQLKLNHLIEMAKIQILNNFFGENSTYKSYYENEYKLGDLLPYEQPGPFIVNSTKYNNDYSIPVLTPGKTFILGYTNEITGIYKVKNSKVIIFDDFTTAMRLVDFDFKVKSSAMKILHSSNEEMYNIDYLFYKLQTIKIISDTHKRFWISEYMPLKIKIHKIDEQKKIVKAINDSFTILDSMSKFI